MWKNGNLKKCVSLLLDLISPGWTMTIKHYQYELEVQVILEAGFSAKFQAVTQTSFKHSSGKSAKENVQNSKAQTNICANNNWLEHSIPIRNGIGQSLLYFFRDGRMIFVSFPFWVGQFGIVKYMSALGYWGTEGAKSIQQHVSENVLLIYLNSM